MRRSSSGYRYMDANNIMPRFEFGFGLSYTTFASGPLSIPSGSKTVTFTVKNTGDVVGTEIVQLYLALPAGAGKLFLRGFEEVPLAVGESKSVAITASQRDTRRVPSLWT
ncbi:hypothetical protein PC9H_008246 [Pleurotus ostreatus]|uniref:beta-glucosidase n=1 Tax=Pleurotus ostreatus TaxID=5322 RepID=A0A8H6ZWG2_PLEOS|nr:uncharacterized protein PC9H_008246 [Pleurotus ostreatus]KAF7429008.1 hypothetical protein PC9H_008246 [Pleurotus ostreatus]